MLMLTEFLSRYATKTLGSCRVAKRRNIHGHRGLASLAIFLIAHPFGAWANPAGPNVTHGQATISGVGTNTVTIHQATQHAIINWQQFNIAEHELTQFLQPSKSSIALNRILDSNPSRIFGRLEANGSVILLNRNGILFGPHSQINVKGSFFGTSLDISDLNFLGGNYLFTGQVGNGLVKNEGAITAVDGAYLIAPHVDNSGVMTSADGTVALAAGTAAYLSTRPDGNGLLVEVKAPTGEARNVGELVADGGYVNMAGLAVNQEGLIQANTVQEKNGKIELVAMDTVTFSPDSETIADGGVVSAEGLYIDHEGLIQANRVGAQEGKIDLLAKDRVNLQSGSELRARGGNQGISPGGTILALSDLESGTTTFEEGAVIDVSGGPEGGDGGFAEISGQVVNPGGQFKASTAPGFTGGRILIDPEGNTFNTSFFNMFRNSGVSEVELFFNGDITVSQGLYDFSQWGSGANQNTHLILDARGSGADLLFDKATFTNNSFTGFVWNMTAKAGNNIEVRNSSIFGGTGGLLRFEAQNNFMMSGSSEIINGLAFLGHTSSNISIEANTGNVTLPVRVQAGGNQAVGLKMEVPGRLDILAPEGTWVGSINRPPGFIIKNQQPNGDPSQPIVTASVELGGQAGTQDHPLLIFIGEDSLVEVEANDTIYVGMVADELLSGQTFLNKVGVSGLEEAAARFTSWTGDIHLDPAKNVVTNDDRLHQIYPPSFTAKALEGNIFIDSQLKFWPSRFGTLDFFAKHNIEGIVPSIEVINRNVSFWRTPIPLIISPEIVFTSVDDIPLMEQFGVFNELNREQKKRVFEPLVSILKGEAQPVTLLGSDPTNFAGPISETTFTNVFNNPATALIDPTVSDIQFSTSIGDIRGINFSLDSPGFPKKVAIDAGGNIAEFGATISLPEDVTSVVRASNINLEPIGTGASITGIRFIGTGIGEIETPGNLDLGTSNGIEFEAQDRQIANQGGLVRIKVGGNLNMTASKIITRSGASIVLQGHGGNVKIVQADGFPHSVGNKVLSVQADPLGPDSILRVDGKEIEVFFAPVVLDDSPEILNQEIVLNGDPVLHHGKHLFQVQHEGKAILVKKDGQQYVVLEAEGEIVLADAQQVWITDPLGGSVNVGSNRGGNGERGILTQRGGSITMHVTDEVNVNLSRIATLGGGNIDITADTISAGSGGRDEVTQFVLREDVFDEEGNKIDENRTVFQVPGSGIFTFHPKDPQPLVFPEFDTPAIQALKNLKITQEFFGRDTSDIDAQIFALVEQRTPAFIEEFDQFLSTTHLGNIRLTARTPSGNGRLIIPPAGIRGADILIDADIVDFQGGQIFGRVVFDSPQVNVPQGSVAVVGVGTGGFESAGSASGGTLAPLGGSTGTVTTAASTTSATSATTSETLEEAQETTTEAATQEAKAQAQGNNNSQEQVAARRALNLREGVTIQVEVKERETSEG